MFATTTATENVLQALSQIGQNIIMDKFSQRKFILHYLRWGSLLTKIDSL